MDGKQLNKLYPLKFLPVFKEKIWGGSKIRSVLGFDFGALDNCGEAWLLSGVQGEESIVCNGFLEGNDISELIEVFMGDLLGDKNFEKYKTQFPLLFKLIDAKENLSIQVHPNQALAEKMNIGNGKNEMWYVLDTDKNTDIVCGFNRTINKELFEKAIAQESIEKVVKTYHPSQGDVFYIPGGRIHGIGGGILLAEIQQSADTTYRIYDWNRFDTKGKPRELHIAQALEALDYTAVEDAKVDYLDSANKTTSLVDSEFFQTNIIKLDKPVSKNIAAVDSFIVYFCVDGAGVIKVDETAVTMRKGELVLIPAIMETVGFYPDSNMTLLETTTFLQ